MLDFNELNAASERLDRAAGLLREYDDRRLDAAADALLAAAGHLRAAVIVAGFDPAEEWLASIEARGTC